MSSTATDLNQHRGALRPTPIGRLPPLRAVRLLDQLRERIRYLHYSRSTEDVYVYWCRAFIRFHGLRHPREMGGAEVEAFLTWLADERQVASATHKQALSALLFLYTKVLEISLPWVQQIERPRVRRQVLWGTVCVGHFSRMRDSIACHEVAKASTPSRCSRSASAVSSTPSRRNSSSTASA